MSTEPVRLSDKQEAFIRTLLETRDVPDEKRAVIGDPRSLDKKAATKVIEYLLGLSKKTGSVTPRTPSTSNTFRSQPLPSAPSITDEGMYQSGNDIYRVQRSRAGRLYAEQLTPGGSFVYIKGAVYNIRPEHRMSVEQAKAYGLRYGRCCVCGKTLTDPASIQNGIGPVCAKGKYFAQSAPAAAPTVGSLPVALRQFHRADND